MSAKILFLCALWCLCATPSLAQGFANLGRSADAFSQPERGYVFQFPEDHGAHPDFQIEWWYLTANLTDETGRDLGLQWTLFRSAVEPSDRTGWDSPQLWMGHAAVTTPDAHYVAERLSRGGVGQAGVTADPFEAWIDEWRMAGPSIDKVKLTASSPEFAYDVTLTAQGPIIFHGEDGYSQKSASGRASYYYSQPFYRVEGTLTLPEGDVPVVGTAWLDREWASQPLAATQVSWDWFSMVFDNGVRLMGFTLHDSDGSDYTQATWIDPDGSVTAYPDGAFQAEVLARSDVAGRSVPTGWRVRLPARDVDVTVSAINPNAWMNTTVEYWEGPVRISGSHQGRGYLEMTGY
ncbi:MAG: lipocalin-like domain-containing protein [Roseobacter sp.]|jgi:predicted secreted hydrolase|nr:lipocalin-like domain-containing protein [Roseobacter sp.]